MTGETASGSVTGSRTEPSVWDGVIGQPVTVARLREALRRPVHAYLFVGPPGSGKRAAARATAATLLAGDDDPTRRDARLVLTGDHPDVREVERVGAAISNEQVTGIIRAASLAPVEGERKVIILDEFHLLRPDGAARLLKTLEEPPASTTFIVIADQVPPELVTIASRCVRIDFHPISDDEVARALVAEGIAADAAHAAAAGAAGDLDRARVLAVDPDLAHRRAVFAHLGRRLDGAGSTVVRLCDEVQSLIERAGEALAQRQTAELADLEVRVAASGERGSGRKGLEERHKRELRRHRIDELRSGLATTAGAYRDSLVRGGSHRPDSLVTAVHRIQQSIEALDRNPNETLLLQSLLMDLPSLA